MAWAAWMMLWELLKIRDTFVGVPTIRITVFWGLYWGSPYLGRLPYIKSAGLEVCIRFRAKRYPRPLTWGRI